MHLIRVYFRLLEPIIIYQVLGPVDKREGNGKTSLSQAIAESLRLPLFVVSYEQLIISYLGETAKNINEIFEFNIYSLLQCLLI